MVPKEPKKKELADMGNPLEQPDWGVKALDQSKNYLAEQMRKSQRDYQFEKELTSLINKHSIEQDSNTPDYILARYIMESLQSFNRSVSFRERWFGR